MQTKTKQYEIRKGRTEIDVSHEGERLTYSHPAFRGNVPNLADKIEKAGLIKPTFGQTISIIHPAYVDQEGNKVDPNQLPDELKDTRKLMERAWGYAFTFTRNGKEGVYVQDLPEMEDGRAIMEESDLVKKLGSREVRGVVFSDDNNIRFVPYGFKTGTINIFDFSRNPLLIGLSGSEETAEKAAEIARTHISKPWIGYNLTKDDEPQTRVSWLDSGGGLGDRWLDVGGNYLGDYDLGCAFGVLPKTGEASRAEK